MAMHEPPDSPEKLYELLAEGDQRTLLELMEHQHPNVVAELLETLDEEVAWRLLERIPESHRADVFSHLELDQQARLVERHGADEAAVLVRNMAADDRVDLVKRLDPATRRQLFERLDATIRREVERLAFHPEGTAGSVMTTEVATLRADQTVAEALDTLRAMATRKETIYYNYVVDDAGRLQGIVSLRDLVLTGPEVKLSQLMNPSVISAWVDDDQEEVARMIREYDLLALPILERDRRLAGVVTVDDALDVSSEEATEDFHRMGSVGVITTGLRDAGFWLLYRKRIPWLLVLVFVNILSGAGIAYFEDTIAAHVALVFFLPLLIASGGNAGSQSATLMIRALATGDVVMRDWFYLLGKEIGIALAIGLTMGVAVSLIGLVRAPEVTVVVAMTMVLTVVVGSLIGMLMPFLLTLARLDPATASVPLITSMADIAGVMIYFTLASWLLGTLAGGATCSG